MDAMNMDRRQLSEYPFDGVFYEYKDDNSGGLLNTKVEEVEVLRVKCDIQQTSLLGNAGFLASSYTIFFPLEPIPLTPFSPSLNSSLISFIVTYFLASVIAIFSATIKGSLKSIKILAGDEAKFAPASIIAS